MKNIVIKDERNYKVVSGNAVSILDKLPAAIYELVFESERGFSLNEADSFFRNSEKLYGEVEARTERVLSTFDIVKGNLGVLFSGPKGLGKSLTVRNICKDAIKKGLPVILVKEHFQNITPFIETICQPSVIVIEEFEKIYQDDNRAKKDDLEGQDSLLNLFDSSLEGKKLYLLTCNDVYKLSNYLLNRPGRIHYHFRVNRLSINEITEYCNDKLAEYQHILIPEICSIGVRIPDFSYDMLRAIVFEINTYQCDLAEARHNLNIESQAESQFNYTIHFQSGKTETGFDDIDFSRNRHRIYWYTKINNERKVATANMLEARWTGNNDGSLLLDGIHINWTPDDNKNKDKITKIIFVPAKDSYLADENDY